MTRIRFDKRLQPAARGEFLGHIFWFALTFVAAAIGAAATGNAAGFYGQLQLPAWAPPAWLFGPAWTVLYVAMAIAAWLVWRRHSMSGARMALSLYIVQLAFNALWSWLFFGWQLGAWSFACLVLLWLLIVATLVCFWRLHRLAGGLLVPYLAWVTFAGALNYMAWQLNPQVL